MVSQVFVDGCYSVERYSMKVSLKKSSLDGFIPLNVKKKGGDKIIL